MRPWRGSASAVDEHAALEGVGLRCGRARGPGEGRPPLWTSTLPWRGSASAVDEHAALEGVSLRCRWACGTGRGRALPL